VGRGWRMGRHGRDHPIVFFRSEGEPYHQPSHWPRPHDPTDPMILCIIGTSDLELSAM
jgi:hypothetical protein